MKTAILRWALLLAALGGLAWSTTFLRQFARLDPLAQYRNVASEPQMVAIEMRNVAFREYSGPKLTARAKIGRMTLTRDRQTLRMFDITDGIYERADGPLKFEAKEALYSFPLRQLDARQGARVINKNLDLQLDGFSYFERESKLSVPGPISGRYFDGQIVAASLVYRNNPVSYETGAVSWQGNLENPKQPGKRSRWSIKSKSTKRAGEVEIWTVGQASDGDVVVKADRLERNVRTDVIVATGNVRYFAPDANMICDKATIYRADKRAVFEKNVQMFVKAESEQKLEVVEMKPMRPVVPNELLNSRPPPPTPDTASDQELRDPATRRKYPTQIQASRVEYWYRQGQRKARITGNPQARQELPAGRWRQIWADAADYDAEKDTLRLRSGGAKPGVRVKTSIGDDLRAVTFTVSTKEGDDTWEGEGLEGDVLPDDGEIPNRGGAGGGTTGGEVPPPTRLRGQIRG